MSVGDLPIDGSGLGEGQIRAILERRAAAAAERSAPREAGVAVLVCLIGGERFALPLSAIAEVLPAITPVPVPTAPASLAGLFVTRGVIFNLMDASAALGVAARLSVHVLLLRAPVPRIALRVDEAVATGELPHSVPDGNGLTETGFFADGTRIQLIAPERLIARIGQDGRTGAT